MSRQARRYLEITALCAVGALAAVLLAPAGRPAGREQTALPPSSAQSRAAASRPAGQQPEAASPEQIASLFGWRPPKPPAGAPPPPPPPAVGPPLPADWLSYLGFVADAGGSPRFLYKDRRTGKVVSVSSGSPQEAAWRLVETRERELLVEHEGKLYLLKKGK